VLCALSSALLVGLRPFELDGEKWSVVYAPLGTTRHKSRKSSQVGGHAGDCSHITKQSAKMDAAASGSASAASSSSTGTCPAVVCTRCGQGRRLDDRRNRRPAAAGVAY